MLLTVRLLCLIIFPKWSSHYVWRGSFSPLRVNRQTKLPILERWATTQCVWNAATQLGVECQVLEIQKLTLWRRQNYSDRNLSTITRTAADVIGHWLHPGPSKTVPRPTQHVVHWTVWQPCCLDTSRHVLVTSPGLRLTTYYIFWECVYSLSYPARNAHAPYCHLCPAPLDNNFPHYFLNGTILWEKKRLTTKCVNLMWLWPCIVDNMWK
jgi:hypothetical protein